MGDAETGGACWPAAAALGGSAPATAPESTPGSALTAGNCVAHFVQRTVRRAATTGAGTS